MISQGKKTKNVLFVQQFVCRRRRKERKICVYMQLAEGLCLHTSSPIYHHTVSFHVLLTFSLVDGGGLVGGAWVCVTFDTQQTALPTSGTGLRVLSVNASSFLGCVSAAASTVSRNRENRREFGGVDVQCKSI